MLRANNYLIFLFLSITCALFIIHLLAGDIYPPPWDDEASFLFLAKGILKNGVPLHAAVEGGSPLLVRPAGFHLLLSLWILFFGDSLAIIRLLPFLLSILTLFLLLLISKEIVSLEKEKKECHKGVVCLIYLVPVWGFFSPPLILQANMARSDFLVAFLGVLSCYLLLKNQPLKSILTALFAFNFHFYAVFALLPAFLGVLSFKALTPKSFTKKNKLNLNFWIAVAIGALITIYSASWFVLNYQIFFKHLLIDLAKRKEGTFATGFSWIAVLAFGLLIGFLFFQKKNFKALVLFLYSLFFMIAYLFQGNFGPWYAVYFFIGFSLMCLSFIIQRKESISLLTAFSLLPAFLLFSVYYKSGFKIAYGGITFAPFAQYLSKKDKKEFLKEVRKLVGV
ncbi:MAG: hypothetical protein D6780_00240, partial [Candidatus Dadabacteria bacterium]